VSLLTIENSVNALELREHSLVVRQTDSAHVVPKQNLHIIDKDYLLGDQYGKFVDTVCQN
jgi:hypothetical protein